tara:strand:- start:2500 stop:5043 length:2544 start_codon:yes stop_codon:yes gene_type:complete
MFKSKLHFDILKHLLVTLLFIIISVLFFSPILKGKKIYQPDIVQYTGMSKELKDYRLENNEETYWINNAFSGMPTYQLGAKYPHNYIKKLDLLLRFLPRPADYLFLYLIGFYILCLSLKIDYRLSILGALAFGFSTYLIIIIGEGHNSKVHAIAYMPLVIAGIITVFRKKFFLGFILSTIALALQFCANHYQMTYYLMITVIIIGFYYLIHHFFNSQMKSFAKSLLILFGALFLSILMNASVLMTTYEYSDESQRGKSELTINPDGSKKTGETSGIAREEITRWSYGIFESFNLFIPRIMGGASAENLGKSSNFYKIKLRKIQNSIKQQLNKDIVNINETSIRLAKEEILDYVNISNQFNIEEKKEILTFLDDYFVNIESDIRDTNVPTYWGEQPGVAAPAYLGVTVFFLFIFSIFLSNGKEIQWVLTAIFISLILSFGKNLSFITNFFIDFFPLYDKFRAVTSIQIIIELCVPLLAVLGLNKLFQNNNTQRNLKFLIITLCIFLITFLILLILKSFLSFSSVYDSNFPDDILNAIIKDRKSLYVNDIFKSLIYVFMVFFVLFAFIKNKINKNLTAILIVIFVLFDLISFSKNYVNDKNFKDSELVENPFEKDNIYEEISRDTTSFRIIDYLDPAKSSYYFKSVLGYSAVKLKSYNDILNFYILNDNPNKLNVLSMLNTKYIISENGVGVNPLSSGNAWFVGELENLSNRDQEIIRLESLDFKNIAISTEFHDKNYHQNSDSSIDLIEKNSNYLKYKTNNTGDGFAVFSEIYYPKGWTAYIDGAVVPHYRVNYLLRGMEVKKGEHIIEFKFDPKIIKTSSRISLAGSLIFLLIVLPLGFRKFKKINS